MLETVLEVADSTLTYRSRYNLLPNIAAVYDLVLLDDTNPRSLFFQINHWRSISSGCRAKERGDAAAKILRDCTSRLRTLDPRELAGPRRKLAGRRNRGQAIAETLRDLPRLSDAIAVSYFAHSEISRTGGGFQP